MKKLLFILAFIYFTSIANAQWQQTSLDTGFIYTLTTLGTNIIAGGDSGVIYLSQNGGVNWSLVNNGIPNTAPVVSVIFKDSNNIFVGTQGNGIFISTDFGTSWLSVNNGFASNYIESIASKDSLIFAGTWDGVYLSTNNGLNWTLMNSGIPMYTYRFKALTIKDTIIFLGTQGGGIFSSSVYSVNWTALNNGYTSLFPVNTFAINGNDIYVGNGDTPPVGEVYKSSNNGTIWTKLYVDTPYYCCPINAIIVNGTNILTGSWNGVRLSVDDGLNWIDFNNGFNANTGVLSFTIVGDTIFAGTYEYGIWKLSLSLITGVKDVNDNHCHRVYPNPSSDKISIEFLQNSTIEILNIQGQTILQRQIQQDKTDIDISGLAKGLYILKLKNNDKTEVIKILKE